MNPSSDLDPGTTYSVRFNIRGLGGSGERGASVAFTTDFVALPIQALSENPAYLNWAEEICADSERDYSELACFSDVDGDGMVAALEFALGTNPFEPDPELAPKVEVRDGEVFLIYQQRKDQGTFSLHIMESEGFAEGWIELETPVEQMNVLELDSQSDRIELNLGAPEARRFFCFEIVTE